MRTLDRYIATTVVSHFLFALGTLLAIFSVINLMHELADAGTAQYDLRQALWFVIMTLPAEAYELFPAAALLGGVSGLGALAGRNELVAIWAGGVSRGRLAWSVVKVAVALMFMAAVLGDFVAAPLAQRAGTQRSVALSGGVALSTANGFWARDGSKFINVRSPFPGTELRELYIYRFDDQHRMDAFTYARTASYEDQRWTLQEVVANQVTDDVVRTQRIPTQAWDTSVSVRQLRLLFLPPEYLSLSDLSRSITSLQRRGESPSRHRLAFWRRLTMPATTAIMMFLSMPFVLVVAASVKVGQRIAAGALLGIGFQMFNQTFGQFGLVYGLPPILSAVFPAALALAVALWLMRRAS